MLTIGICYNIICLASNDETKTNNEVWLSLVERCVRDAEVAGSNPVAPTIQGFRYMGERILGRGNRRGF